MRSSSSNGQPVELLSNVKLWPMHALDPADFPRERMPAFLYTFLSLGFLLLSATPSWSAFSCYDEDSYPSVVRLEQTGESIRITLGRKFLTNGTLPVLSYSPTNGWRSEPGCRYPGHPGETVCFLSVPNYDKSIFPTVKLSRKQAISFGLNPLKVRQSTGHSIQGGQSLWISVLLTSKEESEMDEGDTWVQTIGRYTPTTGQLEVRRPSVLIDSWITSLAHDGRALWFGTAGHCGEGDTFPPTHGLVRYDWSSNRTETFEGKEEGPCGFVVHDLVWHQEMLWVATDLGLSQFDNQAKKWKHFVPDLSSPILMRPITCENLYDHLLRTAPTLIDPVTGTSSRAQLMNALSHFKPQRRTTTINPELPN